MDGRTRAVLHVRARHLKRDLDWLLWVTGTSMEESRTLMGAWYLLYALVVLIVWAVLSWAALENACAEVMHPLPPSLRLMPLALLLGMWCAVALARGIRALWKPPFRLLPADVAWLSGSGSALMAMALSDVVLRCVGVGALGILAGLLATAGMGPDLRFGAAVASALAGACAVLLPCCVAEARLASRGYRASLAIALVGSCALAPSVLFAATPTVAALPPLVVACLLCTLSALLGREACVPLLVCESMLEMDPATMRWISLTNRALFRELTRNRRLARRGPLVRPPLWGRGWTALVSRAVIVHLRRFEGLGDILVFGGICVPLLCMVCLVPGLTSLLVPCAAGVVMSYQSAHVLVRVFCEDEDNSLVRPLLPMGPLLLLVADSLPALLLSVGASCLACSLSFAPLGIAPQACALCVLLDVATMLCGGLSRVVVPLVWRHVSFEIAFFIVIAVTCLVSLMGSWLALLAALALLDFVGVAAVYFGSDMTAA